VIGFGYRLPIDPKSSAAYSKQTEVKAFPSTHPKNNNDIKICPKVSDANILSIISPPELKPMES